MYKSIKKYFNNPISGKVLGVSGISSFYPIIDMRNSKITEISYPEIDMQNLPYKDNAFDFVISDQVIEHLENPQKAINESYRVLKTGGIAIHTTCFINYIHCFPKDFWRFSPDTLKYLCRDFSEILLLGNWGNRFAILLCFLSEYFRYMKIPDNRCGLRNLIATYNEERYPITVWIIAKK